MRDIIGKNWRRKIFDLSDAGRVKELKIQLMSFMQDAFFDQNDKKVSLTSEDQKMLSEIFYWLVGSCNPIYLQKAPLFTGNIGTGKTVLMKGILEFIDTHYSHDAFLGGISNPVYIQSKEMANYFKENNTNGISKLKTCSILAIDDIGYEAKTTNYFGTEAKPFEEILMSRYDKRKTTLMTTNLPIEEIGKIYGWHIYDRIKQTSFVYEFKGHSKREKV